MAAQTLGTLLIDVKSDTTQLISGFNKAERAVNKTTKNMANAVKTLTAAYLTLNAVDVASNFTKQADAMTLVNSKLKLVTTSSSQLLSVQKELFKISQESRQSFTDTVDLYSRIARSTKNLNLSQDELLKTVSTISKALIISGGSSESMNAALVQLGQGFASGTLRGEELNSVMEQTPRLATAIAEGMGLTVGQLREYAAEGKITSQAIIESLRSQRQTVNKEFGEMTQTIGQSSTKISNEILRAVGEFDKVSGFSKGFSKSLDSIAVSISKAGENIPTIIETSKQIALIGASLVTVTAGTKAYTTAVQLATTYNLLFSGSFGKVNQSILLATASMKAFDKILKASGVGLATGAIYLLIESFNEATAKADTFKWSIKDLNSELSLLPFKQRLIDVTKQLSDLDERFKGYNDTQKLMYKGAYDGLFRERKELEKNIALIESKNKAQAKGQINTVASSGTIKAPSLEKGTKSTLTTSLTDWQNYYKTIGDYSTAWMIKEAQLRTEYIDLNDNQFKSISEAARIEFFKDINKKEEKNKDTLSTSLNDWQNYYKTIGNYSTAWFIKEAQLRTQYVDLTEAQFQKMAEVAKIDFFDKLDTLKDFDFKINVNASGFDGVSKAIVSMSNSFDKINKEQKKFNDFSKKYQKIQNPTLKDKEKFNKAESLHLQNQLNGYSAMAGAVGSMFEQGSREAAAFQAIQSGIAVVSGINAILTQGSGDPFSAFARMAAMAASVTSLLSSANIAFGGNSVSVSSDAFSAQSENLGTGTVLGDSSKASQSITNSLEILEDFAEPQFKVLNEMNKSVSTIAERIGGISSLLIKQGGFGFGEGFQGFQSEKQNISIGSGSATGLIATAVLGGAVGLIADKILGGLASNLLGGIVNTIFGGLFGKTSVKKTLIDYGLNFNNALLTEAMDQIDGQTFQTIKIKIKKKSWFGSSTKTKIRTYFNEMDNEIERQFSMVLKNLYDTTIIAGKALDTSSEDVQKSLTDFVVKIGKISTKGKTGEQLQEQIQNIFSQIGDDIAKTAFPELEPFQKIGEGLFETMTRVATGMQQAEYFIERLGKGFEDIKFTDIVNKQGDVGLEVLAQSIIKADEAVFGLNNGVVQMVDNFKGTTEELFNTYKSFQDIRTILIATNHSAKDLNDSMVIGAGSIGALKSATDSYMKNFLSDSERLKVQLSNLSREFKAAGYELPKTRKDFINLIESIDTSTEEGAKAYGRLIGLSDKYNDTISELEENTKALMSTFGNLSNSLGATIKTLLGASTGADNQTKLIKDYWEKRKEIDELTKNNSSLSTEQQERLSSLVGDINKLATDIQKQDTINNKVITDELVGNLGKLQDRLDLSKEILSVKIVGIDNNVALTDITQPANTPPSTSVSSISTSAYNSANLETNKEIKNLLVDIKEAIATNPKDIYDTLDDVINGNQTIKVEVQS